MAAAFSPDFLMVVSGRRRALSWGKSIKSNSG
jgi:hypothetical protein